MVIRKKVISKDPFHAYASARDLKNRLLKECNGLKVYLLKKWLQSGHGVLTTIWSNANCQICTKEKCIDEPQITLN